MRIFRMHHLSIVYLISLMASVNHAGRWSHVYYDTKAIHAQGWPHFLRIFYNAYTKNSLILVLTQFVWFLTKNKQNFHGHKIPSHSSLNLLEILMIFLFTAQLWFILFFWHEDKVVYKNSLIQIWKSCIMNERFGKNIWLMRTIGGILTIFWYYKCYTFDFCDIVAWGNVTQQRARCIVYNAIRNKVTIMFLPLCNNALLISLLSLLRFKIRRILQRNRKSLNIVYEKSLFVNFIEIIDMLYCK